MLLLQLWLLTQEEANLLVIMGNGLIGRCCNLMEVSGFWAHSLLSKVWLLLGLR